MKRNTTAAVIIAVAFAVIRCGSIDETKRTITSSLNNLTNKSDAAPIGTSQEDMTRYRTIAQRLGLVLLDKPTDHNPQTYLQNIEYFRRSPLPDSINRAPEVPRAMSDAEGRRFFFDGLLPLVETANTPSPSTSEFEAAIREGRVVEPPCATTNSQVLEHAARKAALPWVEAIFADPNDYWPTHNVEIQLKHLGWFYYLKPEHVAPPASIGAWSRYTFYGIPGHTGHIFVIFRDMGLHQKDLVGDNTRRSNEPHGHPYRPEGQTVGFWLPPGVYPTRR